MKDLWKRLGALTLGLVLAGGLLGGCDEGGDDEDGGGDGAQGIWRQIVMQNSDTLTIETVELQSNGTLELVLADFVDEDCMSRDGTWTATEDSVTTVIDTGSGNQTNTVAFTVSGNTLTVTRGDGEVDTYTRVSAMASCDDYDFGGPVGAWSGVLTATVDGTALEFDTFLYGGIDNGVPAFGGKADGHQLQITVLGTAAGNCALGTGTMGIYIPDTANRTNLWTTVMGMATGTINLTQVSATHIVGTFSFNAINLRAGSTVSVTNGFVDILQN